MNYNLKDFSEASAEALFSVGDTVTIKIYDKAGADVTPANPADECSPYGELDTFKWDYSNLAVTPSDYESYTWIMVNQSGDKKRDTDVFASYPKTIWLIPSDVNIEKIDINKGDVWEPEFRVDSNAEDLKVYVELADMGTVDFDQTIINKYTANIAGGGDDQVLRVAMGDTFQIFRLFLSGAETEQFGSRYIDLKITSETPEGQTQTIKKKIPFTQTAAISL